MNKTAAQNYRRIASAIEYIATNFKQQPSLDEIAEKVNLSPFHFQRLFTEWAGVSPKKFLQFTTLNYAKSILKKPEHTLFDTAFETGLSGTGRLHDLFVQLEGMTPGEYKNGGENLTINYSFHDSPFGEILTAATQKGVCKLVFVDDKVQAAESLFQQFPNATFQEKKDPLQLDSLRFFYSQPTGLQKVKLHLKGTDFQLKVWEALLKIPLGGLSTYGSIAHDLQNPNASRAVGTAIGSNPVAFLIPCHRVIQTSGNIGGYMWGLTRKRAMIGWEAAKII